MCCTKTLNWRTSREINAMQNTVISKLRVKTTATGLALVGIRGTRATACQGIIAKGSLLRTRIKTQTVTGTVPNGMEQDGGTKVVSLMVPVSPAFASALAIIKVSGHQHQWFPGVSQVVTM